MQYVNDGPEGRGGEIKWGNGWKMGRNQAREQVAAMPQPPRPSLCLILQNLFTGLLLSRSSELLAGLRGG